MAADLGYTPAFEDPTLSAMAGIGNAGSPHRAAAEHSAMLQAIYGRVEQRIMETVIQELYNENTEQDGRIKYLEDHHVYHGTQIDQIKMSTDLMSESMSKLEANTGNVLQTNLVKAEHYVRRKSMMPSNAPFFT